MAYTPKCSRFDIDRLCHILFEQSPVSTVKDFDSSFCIPERVLSVREAFFAEKETVATVCSVGRISAEMVSLHKPPCIPLCLPGEKISEDLSSFLMKNGYDTIEVVI